MNKYILWMLLLLLCRTGFSQTSIVDIIAVRAKAEADNGQNTTLNGYDYADWTPWMKMEDYPDYRLMAKLKYPNKEMQVTSLQRGNFRFHSLHKDPVIEADWYIYQCQASIKDESGIIEVPGRFMIKGFDFKTLFDGKGGIVRVEYSAHGGKALFEWEIADK